MEHFMEYYDSFLDITIPCWVKSDKNCCVRSDEAFFDNHGYEHDDFLKFPERHGWTVNPSTYHLQLAEKQPTGNKCMAKSDEEFIQSWLFFCLITCIVRTNEPVLKFKDLISESVTRAENTPITNLRTNELKNALAIWHQWADQNREEAKLRLIQSDLILELGRQVVRANLAEGAKRTTKLVVSPKTSLAIMILGETLSAAKLEIMESTGTKVRGWHEDDNEGWGGSELVSSEIRKLKFCPHVEKMLKVQMGSNATLLLAATKHYPGVPDHGTACEKAQNCIYMSASTAINSGPVSDNDTASLYRPQCHITHNGMVDDICKRGECSMVGPNMDDVYNILSKVDDNDEGSEFPLFRIQIEPTEIAVKVEKWSHAGHRPDFATISHVWSQGLGNEDRNEVHQCQLKHLAHLLKLLQPPLSNTRSDASPLFWLDTFAIPVRPKHANLSSRVQNPGNFDDLKKRSIRQIRHVFDYSTHSIIIDKDLCSYEAGNRPIKVAMRLLTSSWMRRLWTLQEAFLSKKMSIACQPDYPGSDQQASVFPGWDFERLMENLAANGKNVEARKSTLSMSGVLVRQLRENLMVPEREVRNRPGDPAGTKGSILIASAWRSVRWRSTSRREDETLALATLLNLDYRETDISKAGVMTKLEPGSKKAMEQRQKMMKEFWQLIHQHWEGSIPSGMIFLPPPRLSILGFGWSPETWMTGKTEDYPYPLARMDHPTDLKPEGLIVRYPGVILYSSDFASRLANLGTGEDGFDFPIDRELNEWYSVSAIEKPSMDVVQASNYDVGNPKTPKRFALIMPRPRPKDRKEVALLVEIYGSPRRRKEGKEPYEVYQCWIITRVWVRRVRPQRLSSFGVIGELTDENQRWCVDDHKPRAEEVQSSVLDAALTMDTITKEPNRTPGASSSMFAKIVSFPRSATWTR